MIYRAEKVVISEEIVITDLKETRKGGVHLWFLLKKKKQKYRLSAIAGGLVKTDSIIMNETER